MELIRKEIENAHQCALDILKPGKKDLEHGLELHRQAVVVETYGFGPGGSDPERVLKAIREGKSGRSLQDVTESASATSHVRDPWQWEAYKMLWDASGVTCVFRNAGEESQDPLRVLRRFSNFIYITDQCSSFIPKALYSEDVREAKREGRHCMVLTSNGIPLTQDWQKVEEEFRYIHMFARMGCRMMHLTYNRRNMLADGCAEEANGGLSDFGRTTIEVLNREGVIIDVSHSGWRSSLEAARASSRPIVASHTTCTGLWHHVRSKPDDVMKAIAESGGLVGICGIPHFIGGSGDINAFLDHIEYAVKLIGADHVGIGTDIGTHIPHTKEQEAILKEIEKEYPINQTRTYESLWPKQDPHRAKQWQKPHQRLSNSFLNFPYFTVGMVQRGMADENILKILGTNMLRVLDDVLPENEQQRVIG